MTDDFGHVYARGSGIFIDAWGAGPFVIHVGSANYRFEDSDMFGPALVNRRGDLLKNPWPPERSPFWKAHLAWRRQGRRLEGDGVTCIYEPLKPTIFQRFSPHSREIVILQEGDDDGGFREHKP